MELFACWIIIRLMRMRIEMSAAMMSRASSILNVTGLDLGSGWCNHELLLREFLAGYPLVF